MSVAALKEILAAAHGMQDVLARLGLPPVAPSSAAVPPTPDFEVSRPTPLREHLIKLGLCKKTANHLNTLYLKHTNNYRLETSQEICSLWKHLHEDGAFDPAGSWTKALKIAQSQAKHALNDMFDMFVNIVKEHMKHLNAQGRRSQPIFDKVCQVGSSYFLFLELTL